MEIGEADCGSGPLFHFGKLWGTPPHFFGRVCKSFGNRSLRDLPNLGVCKLLKMSGLREVRK